MKKRELNKRRLKELRGELFFNRDGPYGHNEKEINEAERKESENNEEMDEQYMGKDM